MHDLEKSNSCRAQKLHPGSLFDRMRLKTRAAATVSGIRRIAPNTQFENDRSPVSTIVKVVKRATASEYSREFSAKVFNGQDRLIELGFRQGGLAGYGWSFCALRPPQKNVAEATGQNYAGRDNSPFFYRFNYLTIREAVTTSEALDPRAR